MRDRFVLLGRLLNLITLVIGLLIGFLLGTLYSGHTNAQAAQRGGFAIQQGAQPIEQISPTITAASAGFGTLLAGQFAADEVDTRGIDLLKLGTNLVNVMASKPQIFNHDELQKAVNDARASKILQMKPSPPPPPSNLRPQIR